MEEACAADPSFAAPSAGGTSVGTSRPQFPSTLLFAPAAVDTAAAEGRRCPLVADQPAAVAAVVD